MWLQAWRRQEAYIDELEGRLAQLNRDAAERTQRRLSGSQLTERIKEEEDGQTDQAKEGEEGIKEGKEVTREGEERTREGKERPREGEERQKTETSRRENLLVMRLTAKEQELQAGTRFLSFTTVRHGFLDK
jgi:hypothetical protein